MSSSLFSAGVAAVTMKGSRSLRWRLQLWHAIVLIAVLVLFGTYVNHLQWETRLQHTDAELNRVADIISTRLRLLFPPPNSARPGPPNAGRGGPGREGENRDNGDQNRSTETASAAVPTQPPPQTARPESRGPDRFENRNSDRPRGDRENRDRDNNDPSRSGNPGQRLQWRPGSVGLSEEFLNSNESNSPLYFAIWDRDGQVLEKSAFAPDPPFPGIKVPFGAFPVRLTQTRGLFREATYVRYWDINILVGRSMASDLAAHSRSGLFLFGVGSLVLLVGLAGGWWFTSRAIRPIQEMSETAAAISGDNLAQRISVSETDSELGQLATVLNNTFDRLQFAFNRQTQFTSDASHELRTPVSVILAQTQSALHRPRSSEEYTGALHSCRRAALRMKRLIDDLLTLARLDAVPEAVPHSRVSLDEITRDTVTLLRPLGVDRGLSVHDDTQPCAVKGDADQLGQLITNLLSNALRYNRTDGEVWLTLVRDGGDSLLTVRDTGEGIPEESLPRLFDRFYRVDAARSRQDGGSGLGLSICKAIVEAHGGTILIASQVGVGTTVTVRLPLVGDAPPADDSGTHASVSTPDSEPSTTATPAAVS
jgi:two-component system OmpR family sensor kinase